MKNNIFKYLIASSLIAGFTSCDESGWQTEIPDGMGSLEITSFSIEVNESEKIVTRASRDISNFLVTINDNTGKEVGQWTYSSMPEIVTLPGGNNYEIIVESHNVKPSEFDNPYYKGSEKFDITIGKITKIGQVTAKLASLKVSVNFSPELQKIIDKDATVTVKGSTDDAKLVFTPSETRSGYFAMEYTSSLVAKFEGKVNGVYIEDEAPFSDVNEGEHHILTYSVKEGPEIPEQSGNVNTPDISLDVTFGSDEVDSNVEIEDDDLGNEGRPGQEENQGDTKDPSGDDNNQPGDDNQGGNDNPSEEDNQGGNNNPGTETQAITFTAYNSPKLLLDKVNEISESTAKDFGNAIVRVNSVNGISQFHVDISSTTDNPLFLPALEDMDMISFELTQPSDINEGYLDNFNLPYGDAVSGKNVVDFNITEFISMLAAFEGLHTFKMTVTDSTRKIGTINLQFNVVTD